MFAQNLSRACGSDICTKKGPSDIPRPKVLADTSDLRADPFHPPFCSLPLVVSLCFDLAHHREPVEWSNRQRRNEDNKHGLVSRPAQTGPPIRLIR